MPPRPSPKTLPSPWPARLTWIALGLTLALVLARATTQEVIRDSSEIHPGSKPIPRLLGPAGSVGLDLLCCIPALLVLLRRTLDKSFTLVFPKVFIPVAELSLWMLASTFWAAEKFSTLILAAHWTAASILLWSTCQLVRDWTRLRLVIAVILSLLPIFAITAIDVRVQLRDSIKYFEDNRAEILSNNSLEPGSFAAQQFERKLHLGESFGYFTSPNTFGGASSLLLVIAVGALIQTALDGERRPWSLITLAIVCGCGLLLIVLTRSKGATATFALAILGFIALSFGRSWLAARSKKAFWSGVIAIALIIAAILAQGLHHGRLPTDTLTFRWKYWIGAAGVFMEHPIRGVGWGNFGHAYLAHRVPSAPEEIKDPHNFLVRFFTELGLVGGILAIALLLRLWWTLTRPTTPSTSDNPPSPGVIKFIAAVALSALGIVLFISTAWSSDPFANFLLALMRFLYLGVTLLIASLVTMRSLKTQTADNRPAPWMLYALLLALAGLLIHNLIDFSLFETGILFLFALLAGSALGIRAPTPSPACGGGLGRGLFVSAISSPFKRPAINFSIASAAWLSTAIFLWLPLVAATAASDEADDAVRANNLPTASRLYKHANDLAWRFNPDYALRAAAVTPLPEGLTLIQQAVAEDPKDAQLYAHVAQFQLTVNPPDAPAIRKNFDTALKLDPNNVPMRLSYAEALQKLADPAAARAQYQTALKFDDQLDKAENKRLTPAQLRDIHQKIDALKP